MKNLAQFVLIATLLVGVFGCSAESSEKVAADAHVKAADARVDAADANARVEAADAHVKAADARVKAADAGVVAADADARVKAPANPPAKAVVSAARTKVVIPSGTLLKVSLIDALNSDTSSAGDRFLASLVRGRVIEAEGSGRVKGRASIRLALTDIVQGDRMVAIITDPLNATADSSTTRDAEIIAGGAGVGAVIGAVAGGKKGAGIGAVTGGGAGTGVVLATKGKEVRYDSETRLNFTLTNSVEM